MRLGFIVQLYDIVLNCLICHLLWCQDVLFPKWHSVVNCSILDILKCLCWELHGLLQVSTKSVVDHHYGTCHLWQPKGLFTLPFLGSALENSEALQSFLPIPCQFHNSLPVSLLSEEFRWVHSSCLLFCSSLDLHIQYSSIHQYNASTISENQCWSHSMRS